MRELIEKLKLYCDQYYNGSNPEITDAEYDKLFDKLKRMEERTGIIYPDSPTQNVGYEVKSKLKKVKYNEIPMLSLDKIKSIPEIIKFINKYKNKSKCLMTLKNDGLSCRLVYENGVLVQGSTRGNGKEGEDVTHNVKQICNIPKNIPFKDRLVLEGEIICRKPVFDEMRKTKDYSTQRNYAAGSIRLLNSEESKERKLDFIAWKVLIGLETNNFYERLMLLMDLGFTVTPVHYFRSYPENLTEDEIKEVIESLRDEAVKNGYPYDGFVITLDDVEFGLSLGKTAHHPLHSVAYKEKPDMYDTILRDIEWNVGKSGIVAPTAIFDEVEIDGCNVNRATLHNLSIIKQLKLGIGDKIGVIKANEIIPRVEINYTKSNTYKAPTVCPSCGATLLTKEEDNSKILYCPNDNCTAKVIARFVQFVSKEGANIEGLSESTLIKFYNSGYIRKFRDIYHLSDYEKQIKNMDGFGPKSYNKLMEAIEKSRNIKLQNYLVALSIPNIGKSAAETIDKYFNGNIDTFYSSFANGFDFSDLQDFGDVMDTTLYRWFHDYGPKSIDWEVVKEFHFKTNEEQSESSKIQSGFCNGKTFVITGKLSQSRSVYEDFIKDNGGKLAGSVSKKTSYLVTNEQSGSSKYTKAVELNIPIITEKEFKELCGI